MGCVTILLSFRGKRHVYYRRTSRDPAEMLLANQASSPETGCYQPTRATVHDGALLPPGPVSETLRLKQNFKFE